MCLAKGTNIMDRSVGTIYGCGRDYLSDGESEAHENPRVDQFRL